MTTTFENARVGDKVWDFIYGFGEVEHIESKSTFPLKIRFSDNSGYTFTLKGQNLIGIPQTLFWDKIKFKTPTQPPRMKLVHDYGVYLTNLGMCCPHTKKRKQAAMLGVKE
jgi:hypothetical protein